MQKFLANFLTLGVLLFLVALPFGGFSFLHQGPIPEKLEAGAVLSASQSDFGGNMQVVDLPLKLALVKKVYFTAYFGQEATYENLAFLKNETDGVKKYRLLVMETQGNNLDSQKISVYFDNPSQRLAVLGTELRQDWVELAPKESVPISLRVVAQPHTSPSAWEILTLAVVEE